MALQPTIHDYTLVDPATTGDTRGTKPYIALKVGGRLVRQFTADTPDAAALFEVALRDAQRRDASATG